MGERVIRQQYPHFFVVVGFILFALFEFLPHQLNCLPIRLALHVFSLIIWKCCCYLFIIFVQLRIKTVCIWFECIHTHTQAQELKNKILVDESVARINTNQTNKFHYNSKSRDFTRNEIQHNKNIRRKKSWTFIFRYFYV